MSETTAAGRFTILEELAFGNIAARPGTKETVEQLNEQFAAETEAQGAPRIGRLVWFHSRGMYRCGVVTKVGRTNAQVMYTTTSALNEAMRTYLYYLSVNVEEGAKEIARGQKSNWRFYIKEIAKLEGLQERAKLSEREQQNLDTYRKTVAEHQTKEAYVAAKVSEYTIHMNLKLRKNAEFGPRQYIHFTNKSVRFDELWIDPVPRIYLMTYIRDNEECVEDFATSEGREDRLQELLDEDKVEKIEFDVHNGEWWLVRRDSE